MAGRSMYPNPYMHMSNNDLPPGWEMLMDRNTGWPYFIDHNTKTTSWEDPRMRMRSSFPQSTGFSGNTAPYVREIPVVHESSRPDYSQQWQPQGPGVARVSTPPRSNTPPRSGTPTRQAPQVREIPVQHIGSSSQHQPDLQGYTFYTGNPAANQGSYPSQQQTYPSATGFPSVSTFSQSMPNYSQPQPSYQHVQPQHQMTGQPPYFSQPQQQNPSNQQMPQQHYSTQQPPLQYPQQQGPQQGYPQQQQVPQDYYPPQSQYNMPPTLQQQAPPVEQQYHAPPPSQIHQPPASSERPPSEHRSSEREIPVAHETFKSNGNLQMNNQQHHEIKSKENTAEETGVEDSKSYDQTDSHNVAHENIDENSPLGKIHKIISDVKEIEEKVNSFTGTKTDKEYRYLEEMLTRSILKLDGIESGSDLNVRQARRNAVKEIQGYLDQLELKAFSEEKSNDQESEINSQGHERSQEPTETVTEKRTEEPSETIPEKSVKEMSLDSEVKC